MHVLRERGELSDALAEGLKVISVEGLDVERCLAVQASSLLSASEHVLEIARKARLDGDEDVRVDAMGVLAGLAAPETEDEMLESLIEDPVADVKVEAVGGLGRMRSVAAVDILSKLAVERTDEIVWDEEEQAASEFDEWTELQRLSIEALGLIGDARAVPALITAVTDEFGQELWREALTALLAVGGDGPDFVVDQLTSASTERVRKIAGEVLVANSASLSADVLARLAGDLAVDVRLLAARAVTISDADLVDALSRDDDARVRCEILKRVFADDAVRLAAGLGDNAAEVRAMALRLLAALPTKLDAAKAEKLMQGFLDLDDPVLTAAVVEAAPQLAPAWSHDVMRTQAAKRSANLEVRRCAVAELGARPTREGVETLKLLVGDPLRPVRLASVGALADVAARQDTDGADGELAELASSIILSAGRGELFVSKPEPSRSELTAKDAVSRLDDVRPGSSAAKDDDAQQQNPIRIDREGNIVAREDEVPDARASEAEADVPDVEPADAFPRSTLDAIQGIGTVDSLPLPEDVTLSAEDFSFLELAQGRAGRKTLTPDPKIPVQADARLLSCKLLGRLARADSVALLVELLGESDIELRASAARSLSEILAVRPDLGADCLADLDAHLGERTMIVRLSLVRCLAALGPQAREQLLMALQDDEPAIQAEAIDALGAIDRADCAQGDVVFDASPYLDAPAASVRRAAARCVLAQDGPDAFKHIAGQVFARDGEDARILLGLLIGHDRAATDALLVQTLAVREDPRRRQVVLHVLADEAKRLS